jgi:TolB-like protein
MIRNKICVVLLTVLSVIGLFAQTKPRLAILPFTGGTGGNGETIAQLFSYERELSAFFTIVPRTSSLEAIMKEQQFQRFSGLTDSDTIARLGRQDNADYVMAGHIRTLGARKLVLITIIHVESLRQIAGDYQEYTEIEEVQPMIPGMAKRIVAASRTSGTSLPQLAALPFTVPAEVEPGDAESLAQLLAVEIANSGKYAVLPRTTTIQAVMAEHRIQRSGLTDPDSIKVIGEALNAQYVLAGNVRSLGQTNLFTAAIINIETGSQLTGYAVNYRVIDDGLKLMAELSSKLTKITPPEVEAKEKMIRQAERDAEDRQREETRRQAEIDTENQQRAEIAAEKRRKAEESTRKGSSALWGYANLIGGLGSFCMGDWLGGLMVGGLQTVGITMMIADAPRSVFHTDYNSNVFGRPATTLEKTGGGPAFYIGIAIEVCGIIYGYIRPFQYSKARAKKNGAYYTYNRNTRKENPLERIAVSLIPANKGIRGVNLSYSLNF